MKSSRRPWNRGEKLLFLVPVLLLAFAAFLYQWRGAQPVQVAVSGAPMQWKFSPDGRFIAVSNQIKAVNYLDVHDAKTGALKANLNVATKGLPKGVADLIHFSWASDSKSLAAGYFDLQTGTRNYLRGGKIRKNFVPKLVVWDLPSGVMRGYWAAARPSEFASTPNPLFINDNTQIWSNALPPSLFDARTGKRLVVFGAKDQTDKWQIDDKSKRKLAQMRARIARDSTLNFNTGIKIETKFDFSVEVGQLESRQAQLRDSKSGKLLPLPKHLYAGEIDLAHRSRKVTLVDSTSRRITKYGNRETKSSRLIVWDFALGRELWRRNAKFIGSVAWSNSDDRLAWVESNSLAFSDAELHVADARTGETLWQTRGVAGVYNLVWSPDDKRIAYKDGNTLKILDLPN